MPRGNGAHCWQLLFFSVVGEVTALGCLCQQAGDELIGHLLKSVMDLFFQISKTGRVFLQAVQPFLRMALQALVDFRQHRIDALQGGLLLALQANFHELCLLRGVTIASSCS